MITYSEFLRIRRQEQEDDKGITKLTDQVLVDMQEYVAINKNSLEEALFTFLFQGKTGLHEGVAAATAAAV